MTKMTKKICFGMTLWLACFLVCLGAPVDDVNKQKQNLLKCFVSGKLSLSAGRNNAPVALLQIETEDPWLDQLKTDAFQNLDNFKPEEMSVSLQTFETCVQDLQTRNGLLDQQHKPEVDQCALKAMKFLREIEINISQRGSSDAASDHVTRFWSLPVRDFPRQVGSASALPCKPSLVVQAMMFVQESIPAWPFHMDDPCAVSVGCL